MTIEPVRTCLMAHRPVGLTTSVSGAPDSRPVLSATRAGYIALLECFDTRVSETPRRWRPWHGVPCEILDNGGIRWYNGPAANPSSRRICRDAYRDRGVGAMQLRRAPLASGAPHVRRDWRAGRLLALPITVDTTNCFI